MALLQLRLDAAPVLETIDTLIHIHEALTHRHGYRFRALERRVEAIFVAPGNPVVTSLGAGELIMAPDPKVVEVIRDARALGVIQ